MGNKTAEVVFNREIARGIYEMKLKAAEPLEGYLPGRFVNIRPPRSEQLPLNRPMSVCGVDLDENAFSISYRVIGAGTAAMSKSKKGETIEYMGPLGNWFEMPKEAKRAFIVGGGLGVAAVKFIPEYYRGVEYTVFVGYRSSDVALFKDEFEDLCAHVCVSSDDGSVGEKCVVTDLLRREIAGKTPDVVFACGPEPMLRAVKCIMEEYNTPCFAALEERMGCGAGACRACACRVGTADNWTYKRVCFEGPVFDLREVFNDG